MLEGFVEQYLLRYLGDYIFGVDKQNLSVTTWRGEVHLRSARLKQEVVELLNLPFQLFFGEVADLKINVPWNRLGSRPVVVELTGLRVLLGPKPSTEWSNEEELRRVQLARQRLVDRADLLFGLKEASPEGERKEGYLDRLATRIGDNLELNLRDLHLRYQDDSPAAGGRPVSGGVYLDYLSVQSTGQDWQPSFIERSGVKELFKLLRLRRLSCYHVLPGWATKIGPKSTLTDEDFRRCFEDDPWPKAFERLKKGYRVAYLLPETSGSLKLTQALEESAEKPRFDLQCELDRIQVLISGDSYRGICGIMSLVSEYFAFQEVTRHWIQSYWPHRPTLPVQGSSLLWWRYALRCIRAAAQIRAPAKASFSWLLQEENLSRLRLQAEYCALVVKSRVQLSEEEQARLQRLRVSLPATELLRCHAMALERMHAAEAPRTAPRTDSNWSYWDREAEVLSVPPLSALEAPGEVEAPQAFAPEQIADLPLVTVKERFKHLPSVASWMLPRPLCIAGAPGDVPEMEGSANAASVPDEEGLVSPANAARKEDMACQLQAFRHRPSVGTWLQLKPPVVARRAPEQRSWLSWLLPSRFTESSSGPAESTSFWPWRKTRTEPVSWFRSRPEPEVVISKPAAPLPEAPVPETEPVEKVQSSSSWLPSLRWFAEPEERRKEPLTMKEDQSCHSESPKSPSPTGLSTSPSHGPSAWRVWFSAAEGTDAPQAASPRQAEERRQSRAVAFTEAFPPPEEAPLLRLVVDAEVLVEMQIQKEVKTIGEAKKLRFSVLAGDELSTRTEVADLQLIMRDSSRMPHVDTRLLQMASQKGQDGEGERPVSVSYISRDEKGQPWICMKASGMALFYQQELLQQVTGFLTASLGQTAGKPRRGFDHWRRRAKALLYTRGRPRCKLELKDQTVLVPTRPWPARAPRTGGGPVLALRARFVRAVSEEVGVKDFKHELPGFELVRVDRWTVECTGLQLLHFPSYRAFFMPERSSDWMLLQELNTTLTCLAKRHEEMLPPALLAFGMRQQPKALLSLEAKGDVQSLALSFSNVAYDSFIRAFRLLLRGPSGPSQPPVSPAVPRVPADPPGPDLLRPASLSFEGFLAQSVESISSGDEDVVPSQQDSISSGSPLSTFKRVRFMSAMSGLPEKSPRPLLPEPEAEAEEPLTPLPRAPQTEENTVDPWAGQSSMSFELQVGVLSIHFHCLPTPAPLELRGPAVLSFKLFTGYACLNLKLSSLEMSDRSLGSLVLAKPTEKESVGLSLVAAWEEQARLREAESAELRVALNLGNVRFLFSPMHFRELISFAKTTPPGNTPALLGDPLLWRIRVSVEEGFLQWVDEVTGNLFAKSRMKQSQILLDLHQETVSFNSSFRDFSIQDCSSAQCPMILSVQSGETYLMEIRARTFTLSSPDFEGYHTLVSIAFRSVHLQYMGQKFVKCWQWIFGSFLPALTAGRRKGIQLESSEEETDSVASFMSIEDAEAPAALPTEIPKVRAAELFMELAEGDFAKRAAWEAAEKAVRQAEPWQVPTLTRLHVSIENPVISIPLETSGKDQEPAVEIQAKRLVASNGPCRRQGRQGLVDALALHFEKASISEVDGPEMLAAQDMTVQIDLNLQVRVPPLPMHVLWRAPMVQLQLSSRSLALLRSAFARNVAGVDPDVVPQSLPEPAQLQRPGKFPVWLVFRLLFRNFKLRMQEREDSLAELSAKQLLVEVKKHAAPRAMINFSLWEARLGTSPLVPFSQLLCKRPLPKASARAGRKGSAFVHGEYVTDHSDGQRFEIHCWRPRVLLQMPLLRRIWSWMFPPQPWFAPPLVVGERPCNEMRVAATLHDALVMLVEKPEVQDAPLISVLTNLKYHLQSCPQLQKWSMNFDAPEVFYCEGWPGVLELESREQCRASLAKAHDMVFQVANASQSQGPETSARQLSCKELTLNLTNRDLWLWVACVKRAWGMDEKAEANGGSNSEDALEFNFSQAKLTLVSEDNSGSRVPFLELQGSDLQFLRWQSREKRLTVRAEISLWLFNPLTSLWEPLLEGAGESRKWGMKIVCKSAGSEQELARDTLSIESQDYMLLNISELCWRVLPTLSAPWLSPATATALPTFSPYVVRNDLAVPVTLRLPDDTRLRLQPHTERRLENPKQDVVLQERMLVAVQVEGSRVFAEVEGISLDRVGRRGYALSSSGSLARSVRSSSEQEQLAHQAMGRRKGLGRAASHPALRQSADAGGKLLLPPYFLCRVQAKEDYKMLLLEPPARVINQLNVPVRLSVNAQEMAEEVPPDGCVALPVTLRGALSVLAQGGWSGDFRFEELGKRSAGHFICECPRSDEAFVFSIEWQTELIPHHELHAALYTIRLCAPVTLVSTLPVSCRCEVSGAGRQWTRELAAGGSCQIHSRQPDQLQLRLALYAPQLWSAPLTLPRQDDKVTIGVPVNSSKNQTHLQLVVSWSKLGKHLTVVVHSPTWIADHIHSEHLQFAYQTREAQKWGGGYQNVALPHETRRLPHPRLLPLDCRATHVAFRLRDGVSEAVSLRALGSGQVQVKALTREPKEGQQRRADMGPDSLSLGVRFTERMEAGLEVRVLHVAPQQVAVNATSRHLVLRPARVGRSEVPELSLASGGRAAVHWHSGTDLLQARLGASHWSGRLPVGSVGEYSFQCWDACGDSKFVNFRVEVRNVEATTFIVFREAGTPAVVLRNLSSEALLFQQEQVSTLAEDQRDDAVDRRSQESIMSHPVRWFSLESFTSHTPPETAVSPALRLEPGESLPFAWPEPVLPRRLELRTCLERRLVVRLALEKTEKSLPLALASQQPLFYDVVATGPSLLLTVRDKPRQEPELSEGRELQVNVNLTGLGLSLVAPTSRAFPEAQDGELRRELLFLSADRLQGTFRRRESNQSLELRVQEVQVDNQREDARHPVLLKRKGEGKDDAEPLLKLLVSRCDLHFDRLELALRSIDLRLDQGFILDMMALVQSVRTSLGVSATASDMDLGPGVEKEGRKLHFNHLNLAKATVCVSFAGSRWSGSMPGDVAFWKRLLSSLSSVDRAILRFDGYTLQETTADAENFITTLRGHYYKQFMRELKWFVGGLEVLGTPATFCGSVARSCKEGVLAPYRGARTSPEDMVEGCIVGTNGCVRNAFFECFNSLSKATGAASQGCRICLHEDFQKRRPAPTSKDRRVGEGLTVACGSCFGGLRQGLEGLFVLPARGFQTAGLRGCVRGTGQGAVGCVGGSMVGCLDMTRVAAESFRNVAQQGRREEGRRRLPRLLYGPERSLRPFELLDAELKAYLVSLDPSLASMALLECVRDDEGKVLAVASDIFFLHLRNGKLTKVPLDDIVEVEVGEKVLWLQLHSCAVRLEDDAQRCRQTARLLGACLGGSYQL
ncbi:unnamed protein product [Effrenium voratum]|nr:unnamed protein product [Effrenium voratum]